MSSRPAPSSSASPPRVGAPLIWTNILLFSLTFLVALVLVPWYGLVHGFSAAAWVLFAVFLAANEMAITAGYHRLWAHRTYEAHWSLRLLFVIFGSMALQNSAWVWCSGHRRHHLNVDDVDRDPYSALRGFWFSHMGWMVREYPSGQEDFSNIPDLRRDRLLAFQHRHYLPLVLATNFGLPLAIGWLAGDLWGTLLLAGVLRLVLSQHFTFFINSLAHMWGERPYTEANTARDNGVLAVLTFGEGYHNFHHNFAHDYRNGVRWWQWDPTKWLIAGLQWLGLTRRLKRTPVFQIHRALLSTQFARAQRKLAELPAVAPPSRVSELRQRVAQEYDTFLAAVAEWARVKEQWLEEKKRAVIEHWEHARFQQRLRELERTLQLQRRRLRSLQAQIA
ncbi:MAG: fatty acid desaturase [Steroidobacteraceae bacterium]